MHPCPVAGHPYTEFLKKKNISTPTSVAQPFGKENLTNEEGLTLNLKPNLSPSFLLFTTTVKNRIKEIPKPQSCYQIVFAEQ